MSNHNILTTDKKTHTHNLIVFQGKKNAYVQTLCPTISPVYFKHCITDTYIKSLKKPVNTTGPSKTFETNWGGIFWGF